VHGAFLLRALQGDVEIAAPALVLRIDRAGNEQPRFDRLAEGFDHARIRLRACQGVLVRHGRAHRRENDEEDEGDERHRPDDEDAAADSDPDPRIVFIH
jgi:hypothetical protein